MSGNYPTGIGMKNIINQNEKLQVNKIKTNKLKKQNRFLPRFNKFEIEEEESEGSVEDEQVHKKKTKKPEKFETEINETSSPKSTPSFSLSSYILNGLRKTNTQFHDLS